MVRKPYPAEWDTSRLPDSRRAYLDSDRSFEEITSRVLSVVQIIRVGIKPYKTPAHGEAKDARQAIFLIRVGEEICDLLYNAPDGLRGRYWQSPDHGFEATTHLIATLSWKLIAFADANPPSPIGKAAPMTSKDIATSLAAPSAKIWPRERNDNETLFLLPEHQLLVPRWVENEQHAIINKGEWRKTPTGGDLEIKGALLAPDTTEYLPEGKRDRSCQIHCFGFT
jgi:hypothetical protein